MIDFTVLNAIFYLTLVLIAMLIVALVKDMLRKPSEIEALRKENAELKKQLKEEVERIKSHYETLLKEAALKNTIMVALYNAWKSGKLKECYESSGEVKILADGTLLCSKPKLEESYALPIPVEEEGGEDAA